MDSSYKITALVFLALSFAGAKREIDESKELIAEEEEEEEETYVQKMIRHIKSQMHTKTNISPDMPSELVPDWHSPHLPLDILPHLPRDLPPFSNPLSSNGSHIGVIGSSLQSDTRSLLTARTNGVVQPPGSDDADWNPEENDCYGKCKCHFFRIGEEERHFTGGRTTAGTCMDNVLYVFVGVIVVGLLGYFVLRGTNKEASDADTAPNGQPKSVQFAPDGTPLADGKGTGKGGPEWGGKGGGKADPYYDAASWGQGPSQDPYMQGPGAGGQGGGGWGQGGPPSGGAWEQDPGGAWGQGGPPAGGPPGGAGGQDPSAGYQPTYYTGPPTGGQPQY